MPRYTPVSCSSLCLRHSSRGRTLAFGRWTAPSAPPEIATQIWNRYIYPGMVARLMSGQTIKQSIAWAKDELEGFLR